MEAERAMMESDGALIKRVKHGDKTALAELYNRYLLYVWRYVRNKVPHHPEAAQDAVSETFLAAIQGIDGFDEDMGSFSAWLTGIARHKLADIRRGCQRPVTDLAVAAHCPARSPDPAFSADEGETRERVVLGMHQLPDEDRLLLEWKYLEDLSVKEIAARWGRTEKAVEAQLYRARLSFREFWSDPGDRAGRNGDRLCIRP
jgi:RNA polymerase sigma-70 factor, ECF subfamily